MTQTVFHEDDWLTASKDAKELENATRDSNADIDHNINAYAMTGATQDAMVQQSQERLKAGEADADRFGDFSQNAKDSAEEYVEAAEEATRIASGA